MMSWRPDSYKALPVRQQPKYKDRAALDAALAKVRALPPLVAVHEVEKLRENLVSVSSSS